jgi:hypothetical protein
MSVYITLKFYDLGKMMDPREHIHPYTREFDKLNLVKHERPYIVSLFNCFF